MIGLFPMLIYLLYFSQCFGKLAGIWGTRVLMIIILFWGRIKGYNNLPADRIIRNGLCVIQKLPPKCFLCYTVVPRIIEFIWLLAIIITYTKIGECYCVLQQADLTYLDAFHMRKALYGWCIVFMMIIGIFLACRIAIVYCIKSIKITERNQIFFFRLSVYYVEIGKIENPSENGQEVQEQTL